MTFRGCLSSEGSLNFIFHEPLPLSQRSEMTLSKGATSWVHQKACVGPLVRQGVLHFLRKSMWLSSVVTLPNCMLDYYAQMHSKSNLQALKLSIYLTCTIATKINYGCVSKLGLKDD